MSTLTQLAEYVAQDWHSTHDHIITPLGVRAYCVRVKGLVSNETPKLLTLREHHNVVLYSINGSSTERDRLVGYCLLFSGAPMVHYYTRYTSLSYSEPADLRTRQMRVIFDDPNVRLLRFGVGTFDYLWVCRKRTDKQTQVDVADHAAYVRHLGSWKDGM